MAYKHVIRANTKNLMTDEMFTSAGFSKQPDGSWYIPNSTVLNNKVLWENTEGIAGPLIISLYGKSPQPNAGGIMQFLVTFTDGDIRYINGTGSSDVWKYSEPVVPNPTKTIAKIQWVNITGRPLYLRDVMFEWGSTSTPYTPYNYLSSNKRMIKVSDVCQLLDKSKYPATHTQLGCTFTNNGDGSFTINGTIQNGGSWSNALQQITQNLYGHKILLLTNSTSDIVRGEMKFTLQDGSSKWGTYNSIYTVAYNNYKYIAIRIYMDNTDAGKTIDNAIVKFQLFDLTEMYGAGNEPKTVAEFRERFPNELYNYSPKCWLTSYKSAVVCKTKNLFDISKVQSNPGLITNENGILRIPAGCYNAYGLGPNNRLKDFCPELKVGDRAVLSMNTTGQSYIYLGHTEILWSAGASKVITQEMLDDYILFYNTRARDKDALIFTIQLEQGSTATTYVPYYHL